MNKVFCVSDVLNNFLRFMSQVSWLFFLVPALYCQADRLPLALADQSFYQGCLLFQDDIRSSDDSAILSELKPHSLIRSWYRFGEPAKEKQYESRSKFLEEMLSKGILIGGGTSLSVMNQRDVNQKGFDSSWFATDLNGKPLSKGDQKYGSLSAPGFRKYLIKKLLDQVLLGVRELHLGETNGQIAFDDHSLGLKGRSGFVQWIQKKYSGKSQSWWKKYLGDLGDAIAKKKTVTREMFLSLDSSSISHFKAEWGKENSWHGTNEMGQSAFLAYQYHENLQSFLYELRAELKGKGKEKVAIDIWGSAEWTQKLSPEPDAVISSPPDERWGFNWNTDSKYNIQKDRERIKKAMQDEAAATSPSKLIYMFDHPKPFLSDFIKLSDSRQAYLTQFFADLSHEVGAQFVLRSYSEVPGSLGSETRKTIINICNKMKIGD